MKKIFLLFGILAIVLINCKKDESSPGYSFKDQTLSGKIEGAAWSMQSGWADISVSNQDTTIRFTCYSFASNDPCSATPAGNEVFFSLPKKVGVYILSLNPQDPQLNGHTVTLFYRATYMNNIATQGAVEIISISDTQIKGRIDATSDEENTVNGNFTVDICSGI